MTESSLHEKAEPQLKNLRKTKPCIYCCKIAPKINHITKEKTAQLAEGNARQLTPFQPFLLRLLVITSVTSLLPLLPSLARSLHSKSLTISAQLLRAPMEKSKNKIPSGYPQFPITSIPEANTDETGLPTVLLITQNSLELFSSLPVVTSIVNFPTPEPVFHVCCRFHIQRNI